MKTRLSSIVLGLLFTISSVYASAETYASFSVVLSPAGGFTGKTKSVKGTAQLRGDKVTAAGVVVDLRGLTTGIAVRDQHVFETLQTHRYPTAGLISATGQGGRGEGIIMIRDVKQKVVGTYKVRGNELDADFMIKLSSFGIVPAKYKGIATKDDVHLHITLPLQKM